LYFRDNQHGAVNIFNSLNVTVKNCSFYNNTSDSRFTNNPFQASVGGLSISYNTEDLSNIVHLTFLVSDCTFINNVAKSNLSLSSSVNRLFSQNIYSGRGGGLAIIFNVTSLVYCTVMDCTFINNRAAAMSGGFYSVVGVARSNQTFLFKNNVFTENWVTLAGAFNFVMLASNTKLNVRAMIYNCKFKQNTADVAGAAIVYFYNGLTNFSVVFQKCDFINNISISYAGAIDMVSYNFFAFRNGYPPVEFIDW